MLDRRAISWFGLQVLDTAGLAVHPLSNLKSGVSAGVRGRKWLFSIYIYIYLFNNNNNKGLVGLGQNDTPTKEKLNANDSHLKMWDRASHSGSYPFSPVQPCDFLHFPSRINYLAPEKHEALLASSRAFSGTYSTKPLTPLLSNLFLDPHFFIC